MITIDSKSPRSLDSASISLIIGVRYAISYDCGQIQFGGMSCGQDLRLQVWSADLWGVIDAQANTVYHQRLFIQYGGSSLKPPTWKALLNRKTRSYASLGGRRLRARRTVSDSSGIKSSAL